MSSHIILERLDTMADQLHRATMVQNRSVHIIKQVCAVNAEEAQAIHADVAALLAACKLVEPAIDSLLDGYVSKTQSTDWGLVNDCLCQVAAALALARREA